MVQPIFNVAMAIPYFNFFKRERERESKWPTLVSLPCNNFTVRKIFLSLFIYQTCISRSMSSCHSCSAGTIVGAIVSIVGSHLIQIFNSSYSTVSYMNVLKPRFPDETCLPENFKLNLPFQYADVLCIWKKKKSVLKEKYLPLLLLINNCLGKEHTSMVEGDSPWVVSSVVLFPLRWLSKDFSYKALLGSSFLVQSSLVI